MKSKTDVWNLVNNRAEILFSSMILLLLHLNLRFSFYRVAPRHVSYLTVSIHLNITALTIFNDARWNLVIFFTGTTFRLLAVSLMFSVPSWKGFWSDDDQSAPFRVMISESSWRCFEQAVQKRASPFSTCSCNWPFFSCSRIFTAQHSLCTNSLRMISFQIWFYSASLPSVLGYYF